MNYVGIDLGTTNSAVCSYDGETPHIYQSPQRNDVTPSAIYIDKRGNKYFGTRAYNQSVRSPGNAATLFKRFMGTSTPIKLPAVGLTMTPEECSAEILRLLFGYLPEEVRHDEGLGTVITVPAAFNQMQKTATMSAAESAAIGRVALMQEPVAAVMSVMRQRKGDGVFVVYDLGGGTLDVAIAESISGRVSVLAHGGVAVCGGREFDRAILDNIVKPWLRSAFSLPDDFSGNPKYTKLLRMAVWAAEQAKISLSQNEDAAISLPETDMGVQDQAGEDIYLDVPMDRKAFDALISRQLDESVQAVRDTLDKAGMSPNDIERVVFVGGPTNYKPLRDKVAFELGIAPSTEVNPMTAVAEGAAIFAESVEWSSQSRGRKNSRGSLSAGGSLNITFDYIGRTPDVKTRLVVRLSGKAKAGAQFQIDSLDTGWSSGRMGLEDGVAVELALAKPGENTFKIFVFDANGAPLTLPQDKIVVTRTAATIDAIPASSSIGLEVQDKADGRAVLEYLIKDGDQLPKKGKITQLHAGEALKAGSAGSLRFMLWEGDIPDPIKDNRFIGMLKITGSDFADGVIAKGAELVCEYEMSDSGQIKLEVSVPSIGASFGSGHNFYSRQEGQIDFSDAAQTITERAERVSERTDEMAAKVDDARLEQAREKLDHARSAVSSGADEDSSKKAMDDIQDAKRLLSLTRQAHLKEIRQLELDQTIGLFNETLRPHARPTERTAFDSLARTAQRDIDDNRPDFESNVDELRRRNYDILWRQEWFVIDHFKRIAAQPFLSTDVNQHNALVEAGRQALAANDVDKLRDVVIQLYSIRIDTAPADDDMSLASNIVRA